MVATFLEYAIKVVTVGQLHNELSGCGAVGPEEPVPGPPLCTCGAPHGFEPMYPLQPKPLLGNATGWKRDSATSVERCQQNRGVPTLYNCVAARLIELEHEMGRREINLV
jgi:hypothetical protein